MYLLFTHMKNAMKQWVHVESFRTFRQLTKTLMSPDKFFHMLRILSLSSIAR